MHVCHAENSIEPVEERGEIGATGEEKRRMISIDVLRGRWEDPELSARV